MAEAAAAGGICLQQVSESEGTESESGGCESGSAAEEGAHMRVQDRVGCGRDRNGAKVGQRCPVTGRWKQSCGRYVGWSLPESLAKVL